MSKELTPAQHDEIKALLLARRNELHVALHHTPTADEGGMVQRNVAREVDQALTDIDTADLARIERALEALADGSYGHCDECGCAIPFERLKIEPQTQHCVACKSRWEKSAGQAGTHH